MSDPNSSDKPIVLSATIISIATFLSRIAGLLREQAFAYFFGAGAWTDAFNVAFRIPNLLRDLFAEGAMSAAFVPTFNSLLKQEGKPSAFRLMNLTLNILFIIVGILSVLGIIFSPEIVCLLAPGFMNNPEKYSATVSMTRVMFPFLLVISWSAVAMGGLNSLGEFFLPAIAPVLLNISMIIAGFTLCPFFTAFGFSEVFGMAVGAMIGGILQMAVQFPWLYKHGFKLKVDLSFANPALKRIIMLIIPGTIGLAATQINVAISTILSTSQGDGAVSWLSYAFRLMQLPLGIFGVSIAQATLPVFSRQASDNDKVGMTKTFVSSLKLTAFVNISAAFFLCSLANPIIKLLFEHGRFISSDTEATVLALKAYCVGLFFFSAIKVMGPAFFALNDAKTPLKASIVSVVSNIILNLLLIKPFGYWGLALASSIASVINAVILFFSMKKKLPAVFEEKIGKPIFSILLCSIFMAFLLSLFTTISGNYFEHALGKFLGNACVVSLSLILGCISLLISANLMKIEEAGKAVEMIKRKFIKKTIPAGNN
ncbi:MAG: murein biosynthesis integral membrane protein MurJ [Candidatus Riflebacteria bacterium]|nr:murein biosynthesis integral membrane protein MurJ [Candidatus Riflebacteria bacterium]